MFVVTLTKRSAFGPWMVTKPVAIVASEFNANSFIALQCYLYGRSKTDYRISAKLDMFSPPETWDEVCDTCGMKTGATTATFQAVTCDVCYLQETGDFRESD